MPSFSIVVPTRDRADLVGPAVASVVAQATADTEIIVSDNSIDPAQVTATRRAVEAAATDRDVRYVRPPTPMSMPDHWEFATSFAKHDYLLILTDRHVMRPGTLSILSELIAATPGGPPEIIMWSGISGLGADGQFTDHPYTGAAHLQLTRDVLADFVAGTHWESALIGRNSLPRSLNSAVHRSLAQRIRADRGRLYDAISPDYAGAFLQLAYGSQQLEIDLPFYAAHGNRSNGLNTMVNGIAGYCKQFAVDPLAGCPLPLDTVVNTIYRDYLHIKQELGTDLPPIDTVTYLLWNWQELRVKQELNSTLDIAGMRAQIKAFGATLPSGERDRFEQGRRRVDRGDTVRWRARNMLARAGMLDGLKTVAARLKLYQRGPRYTDIAQAIAANPLRFEGAPAAFAKGR